MTKQQAIQLFKETHYDFLHSYKGDKVARRTAWNDFTDALLSDNLITEKQCYSWTNPF